MNFQIGDLVAKLKLDASEFVQAAHIVQSIQQGIVSQTTRLGETYDLLARGLAATGMSQQQMWQAVDQYVKKGMTSVQALRQVYADVLSQMKQAGQTLQTPVDMAKSMDLAKTAMQQQAKLRRDIDAAREAEIRDATQRDVEAQRRRAAEILAIDRAAERDRVKSARESAAIRATVEQTVLDQKKSRISQAVAPDADAYARSHQLMVQATQYWAQQTGLSYGQVSKVIRETIASSRAQMTAYLYDAERLRRASTAMFQIGAGVTAAGGAVLAGVVLTGKAFADFDQQMQNSISIMQNVDKEMEARLAERAKQVAVEINMSSKDVAAAMRVMASAGMEPAEILKNIGDAAKFARISNMDLARAVQLTSQVQMALGKDLVSVKDVTNALAAADRMAVGGAAEFAEGLNRVSSGLRLHKKSLEEGLSVLMAYHKTNLTGAAAGTQFWMALRDTERTARRHGEVMLEVEGKQKRWRDIVFDSSGVMRNFGLILRDLESAMKGMSPEQMGKALVESLGFPDRSRRAIQVLIGLSSVILDVQDKLKGMGNTVEEVMGKKMATFNEQLGQVKQRLTNLAIEMGEPTIRNAQLMGKALDIPLTKIEQLTKAMKELPMATQQFTAGVVTLGGAAASASGSMILWTAVMTQLAGNLLQLRMLGGSTSGVFRAMTVAFTGTTTEATAHLSTMTLLMNGLRFALVRLAGAAALLVAVPLALYEVWKAGSRLKDVIVLSDEYRAAIRRMKEDTAALVPGLKGLSDWVSMTMPAGLKKLKEGLAGLDWDTAFKGMAGPIFMLNNMIDRLETVTGIYPQMRKSAQDRVEALTREGSAVDEVAKKMMRETLARLENKKALSESEKAMRDYLKVRVEASDQTEGGISEPGPTRDEMLQRLGVENVKKAVTEAQAAFAAYSKSLTAPQMRTAIETLEGLLKRAVDAGVITTRQFREQINSLEIKGLAAIRDQFTDAQWGEAIDYWAGELFRAVQAGEISNKAFMQQARELDQIADMKTKALSASVGDWAKPLGLNLREPRKELEELNKILDDQSMYWGGLAGLTDQEGDSLRKMQPWVAASVGSFREMNSELSKLVLNMRVANGMSLDEMTRQIQSWEEPFADLGIKSAATLEGMAAKADQSFYEITQQAWRMGTDIERAQYAWYGVMIDYWKEMSRTANDEMKALYGDLINQGEDFRRKHEGQLAGISGAHREATNRITGFWRVWKQQVSTIVTDLSRDIVDKLIPKAGVNQDAAGITALGLRAGVTGKQLEELVAKVKQLALATGKDFGSIADKGAEIFQKWGISAAQQIPTLEAFWSVVRKTGVDIDDLMGYLSDSRDTFKALGMSVTEAAAMIGNLTAKGLDVPKILDAMDAALKKITEQGFSNPTKQLANLIERIRTARTETDATAIAMRYFGDTGAMMAKIIRDGSLDMEALVTNTDDAAESLEQAAEKAKDMQKEAGFLTDLLIDMARAFARTAIEAVIFSDTVKGAIGGIIKKMGELLDFIPLVGEGLKKLGGVITGAAGGAADTASKAGKTAGDVGGAAGGIAGTVAGTAVSGAMGMISMITGFAQLGVGTASLIGQRAAGMDAQRTEENTRFCRGYLLELVNRSENWEYAKWIHSFLWDPLLPMIFQINNNLGALVGQMTPAYAAVSASPAQAYSFSPAVNAGNLSAGETVNFYYNDRSVNMDSDARQMATKLARHVVSRGVRSRTGTR